MSELDELERRMERRWQEYVHADIHQLAWWELEHLYGRYLDALEAYRTAKEQAEEAKEAAR